MSEETAEHDAVEHDVVKAEPCVDKEPSFHGRLKLKDFIFSGTAHPSPAIRRSPRLQTAPGPVTVSVSSGGATPSDATPPTPKRKRKSPADAPDSPSPSKPSSVRGHDKSSPSPRKKRVRASSSYAPPSTYAHLPPLVDVIAPNLLILFIGLNPGVQTARSGHAYAHPSNLFWKLLYASGITPVPCRPDEDRTLPARFSLGNTNIVARPSRNGAELSKGEMDAGVAVLEAKCRRWRPEAVCVVGKGIWESIFRVWKGRNLPKGQFEYGWQAERMGAVPPANDSATAKMGGRVAVKQEPPDGDAAFDDGDGGEVNPEDESGGEKADDGPWEGARIFVATSTSGLAASLRPEEKERIWKILGDWCVQRRLERQE
ncbi:DNA glycosylase [Nemania serpens]|nr:DNA glycosylase [Nemania serpens]